MKKPAPKSGRGRPATLPPGTINRSIRLTDAEWKAVKEFVEKMRTRKGDQS